MKGDGSPVTAADHDAEEEILAGLATLLPGVPVLAEESAAAGRWPASTDIFVAVDPMDGTREFLSQNGEFTVNIAIIVEGQPVAGVVQAPALDRLWIGSPSEPRSWRLDRAQGGCRAGAPRHPHAAAAASGAVALVSRSIRIRRARPSMHARHHRTPADGLVPEIHADRGGRGRCQRTLRVDQRMGYRRRPCGAGSSRRGHDRPDGTPLVYGRADRRFRTDPFIACSAAFATDSRR